MALLKEIQKGNLKEAAITALTTGVGLAALGYKSGTKMTSAVAARVLPVMAYNGWSVRPLLQTVPNALHGAGAAMAYVFKGGASNNLLNETTETSAENGFEPSSEDYHRATDENSPEESATESTPTRRRKKRKRRDSSTERDIEDTQDRLRRKRRRV